MADTIKFSQLTEITRPQMSGTDYAVGYKANGDNKKWTFENQADFLLNDSEAGQEFQETFVKVQNAEPTDENNKIWIQETPETEVEVPTYDEFKDLSNLVSGVNEAVFNKLSATADQLSTYVPFTFSTFAGKKYIIKNESSTGGMLARIRQTRDGENGTYITTGTQAGQTSVYEAAEDADYIAVMFGPTTTNPAFSIIQEGDVPSKVDGLLSDLSMIAPIENGTTASKAYSVGQYFLHDDQFCKAKTAIASGATFTLNTNYEVTTVGAELYVALHS